MNILITDGNQRAALAITRSLGRKGHRIFVGEDKKKSLAGVSKYAYKCVEYTSPAKDRNQFLTDIITIIRDNDIDVLFPVTDITTYEISNNKDTLPDPLKIGCVDFDLFELVHNKIKLFEIAQECDLPVPTLHIVNNKEELKEFIDKDKCYPYVLKPQSSRMIIDNQWQDTGVRYIYSFDDIESGEVHFPCMIQKKIEGSGIGFFALLKDGEPMSVFAHERIREKPPSGGVSVLRKSIPIDERLKTYSLHLLKKLNWTGVAMVEYKKSIKDGNYYLMELNGRFWGSLQLAVDSDVDFPYLYLKMLCNEEVENQNSYKIGVVSRWFLGDCDHLIALLTKSKQQIKMLGLKFSQRIKTFISFILDLFNLNIKLEVLRLSDCKPFLYEVKSYFISLCRKNRSSHRVKEL